MTHTDPRPITSESAFDALLVAPLAILFKHSPICSVSHSVEREVQRFLQAHPQAPVHQVDVIAQRALSRGIADRVGVRHESPQVLVLRNGKVTWHASHFDITAAALAEQLKG